MKNPKSIANMLTSFTKRHGIRAQLTAHEVVAEAQRELASRVSGSPLGSDMVVLSYANNVVTFACKNAAARYDAQGVADAVCEALKPSFPSLTLTATCVLRPEAWKRIM